MSQIKILNKSYNPTPQYETEGAAGFDLRAYVPQVSYIEVLPQETVLISTGLYMEIPEGFHGEVRPRSGLAAKHGITVLNTPGTVDSDYRGEIKVMLHNTSTRPFRVQNADRIAQMVISKNYQFAVEEVNELSDTQRGEGGFGSTGVK